MTKEKLISGNMSRRFISLFVLLFLIPSTTLALDPNIDELCCLREDKQHPEMCAQVNMQNCPQILDSWRAKERSWFLHTTPFYLRSEFIAGIIVVFIGIALYRIFRRKKSNLHILNKKIK